MLTDPTPSLTPPHPLPENEIQQKVRSSVTTSEQPVQFGPDQRVAWGVAPMMM